MSFPFESTTPNFPFDLTIDLLFLKILTESYSGLIIIFIFVSMNPHLSFSWLGISEKSCALDLTKKDNDMISKFTNSIFFYLAAIDGTFQAALALNLKGQLYLLLGHTWCIWADY